ncbi:MAG: hypothetical protein ACU0A6_06055 [Shimia sp.]|jgi:predicted metal-dependent enzyme (double-stranded beta helix superfamily)|uniref:hypothetical protein n=1 Tax=Shimia sp. TaxID=1954381 RepID=UPI00405899BE
MNEALNELVLRLRTAAQAKTARADVQAILKEAVADPESFASQMPVIEEDDLILFEDENVSIWYCRFQPGKTVPPHNHKVLATIAVYSGAERNDFYERAEGGGYQKSSEVVLSAGDVFKIGPNAIHTVGVASAEACCGIHVYLGALTQVERSLFDLTSGDALPFTEDNYYRMVSDD